MVTGMEKRAQKIASFRKREDEETAFLLLFNYFNNLSFPRGVRNLSW